MEECKFFMILPRIITAIIGIPIILLCINVGGTLFIVLLSVILIYMLKEYIYLVNSAGYEISHFSSFITGIAIFYSIIFERLDFSKTANYLTSIVIVTTIFLTFFIEILKQKPVGSVGRISVGFVVPMLLSWSLAHLYLIREFQPHGKEYVLMLFFTIWICDTASYVFGSLFKGKKLASEISPKKTISGLVSGIIFGVSTIIVLKRLFRITELNIKQITILGIVICTTAIISDLAESLIKRDCGFKDSDNLLPGHGGMLDRFDSFIFSSPVYFYLLTYLLKK